MNASSRFPVKKFIPLLLIFGVITYLNNAAQYAVLYEHSKNYTAVGLYGILSNLFLLFTIFYLSNLDWKKYLLAGLFLLCADIVAIAVAYSAPENGVYIQLLVSGILFLFQFVVPYFLIINVLSTKDRPISQALIFAFAAEISLFIVQALSSFLLRSTSLVIMVVYQALYLGVVWLVVYIMAQKQPASQTGASGMNEQYLSFNNLSTAMNPASATASQAGTQYRDESHARTTWIASHLNKYTPVIICRFKDLATARNAIEQLSFIKKTAIKGQYLSTEIIEFGCYLNAEGAGEVILCGNQLSMAMWLEAKTKLKEAGGIIYKEQEPKEETKPAAIPASKTDKAACTYVQTERNGMNTYEVYRGASKAQALAFLQSKTVTQRLYYLIVETPEGNFGKDVDGIFEE